MFRLCSVYVWRGVVPSPNNDPDRRHPINQSALEQFPRKQPHNRSIETNFPRRLSSSIENGAGELSAAFNSSSTWIRVQIDNRRGAANRSRRRSTERNPSRAAVGAFIHEAPEIRVRFHLQPTPPDLRVNFIGSRARKLFRNPYHDPLARFSPHSSAKRCKECCLLAGGRRTPGFGRTSRPPSGCRGGRKGRSPLSYGVTTCTATMCSTLRTFSIHGWPSGLGQCLACLVPIPLPSPPHS